MLVAHRHQHVAFVADRLQGLGGDLGRVAGPQLRLLMHVEHAGVLLADRLEHLLGLGPDHQQETAKPLPLEDGDLPVDGRLAVDLEADLDQVASAHAGSLAGGQE